MIDDGASFLRESITKRELEVLQLIGKGLSNQDVADELVISLGTARWYSKQIYGKLNVHSRAEAIVRAGELGLLDGPQEVPAKKKVSIVTKHNLPPQPTLLIGRDTEIEELKTLLLTSRLVTLTGPGGVGKTRLSIQVAANLLNKFPDGVIFVDLAAISDSEMVATTIGTILGIKSKSGNASLVGLKRFLHDKRMLLVLDNFEQVIAAAPVIGKLVAGAPKSSLMVTSREALKVYGEHEYMLQPLRIPKMGSKLSLEELAQYAAITLFLQRARAVKRDFELNERNAPVVADICTRLDGLPLAIELAAARIRIFTPQALLDRLENRFKMLVSSMHGIPNRQRTLLSAIDWSYDLLSDAEKILFARLSVFTSGCSLEAIEAICSPELDHDVLDDLDSLLNKSLLRQEETALGEPRFVMLDIVTPIVKTTDWQN